MNKSLMLTSADCTYERAFLESHKTIVGPALMLSQIYEHRLTSTYLLPLFRNVINETVYRARVNSHVIWSKEPLSQIEIEIDEAMCYIGSYHYTTNT